MVFLIRIERIFLTFSRRRNVKFAHTKYAAQQQHLQKVQQYYLRQRKRERRSEKRRRAAELILDEEDLSAALSYACMNGHMLVVEALIAHMRAIAIESECDSQDEDSTETTNSSTATPTPESSLSDFSLQEMFLEGLKYACQGGHSRVVSVLLRFIKLAPRRKRIRNISNRDLGEKNISLVSEVCFDNNGETRARKVFVNNDRQCAPKLMVEVEKRVERDFGMEEERKVIDNVELDTTAQNTNEHRFLLLACLETAYRRDQWGCFAAIMEQNGVLFQFSVDEILFPDQDFDDFSGGAVEVDGFMSRASAASFANSFRSMRANSLATSAYSADYLAQVLWVTIFRHLFVAIRLDSLQYLTSDVLSHVLSCFDLYSYASYTISYVSNNRSLNNANDYPTYRGELSGKARMKKLNDNDAIEREDHAKTIQRERLRLNGAPKQRPDIAGAVHSARLMFVECENEDDIHHYEYDMDEDNEMWLQELARNRDEKDVYF
jgi:hypothetical protein